MGRKKKQSNLPTYDQFMIPLLKGLKDLGGSATIEELNEKVYEILNLPDEILQIPHSENDTRSEIEYRLAWTRTYLKKADILDNSARGVWALTSNEIEPNKINPDEIVKFVRELDKKDRVDKKESKSDIDEAEPIEVDEPDWKSELLETIGEISPDAFERLAQRILRESGFVQVEVTGKSSDGGIDGKGILKIGGLISFHIIFQCKRYKGTVTPSQIRDFRGAMQGRADKGIFITTGNFTREAAKEATRDGAPPIDLIDGEALCDKLKELGLGLKTRTIEIVDINKDWYKNL
jgi:restriction system protein